MLTTLGWARWYFERHPQPRRWLSHASELSYPFYIFHQTVILIAGWAWLQVPMGPWARLGASPASLPDGSADQCSS